MHNEYVRTGTRQISISVEMYDRIKRIADENERSVPRQVNYFLNNYIELQDSAQKELDKTILSHL